MKPLHTLFLGRPRWTGFMDWTEVANYYQAQRPIVNPTRYSFPTGNGIPFMASDIRNRIGGNDRNTFRISY
ncbi:hypothetical protein [Dyadobacter tibetensis]|uniref:hypothetical protein n=1 Tax=Dyadobacter tibetensis TaxID=1211851 RepID=UPI00103E86DE|nr:hypothetical protein [Dyadobacter tibetensis]